MARQAGARSQYRMADHGYSTRTDQPGFMVFKRGIPYQHYKPSWNRTHTVVRFIPEFDRETGQFMPMRDPHCDSDRPYTDWIRRYDCAVQVGPAQITYIVCDPTDLVSAVGQNPLRVLNMAVANALRTSQADPAWVPCTLGGNNRKKQLTNPEDLYMTQAILMEHNSKPQTPPRGLDPAHPPVLFTMSRSAGEALLMKLAEKDANGNYVYGDILDLNGGAFVDFRQAGTPPLAGAQPVTSHGAPMMIQGQNNNYYEVDILPNYHNVSPALATWGQNVVEQLAQRWIAWDDALWFPTPAEQVQLLCQAGFPASMLVYALGEQFGEHIPPHVRQAANQRGGAAGYGAQPQPASYGFSPQGSYNSGQPQMPAAPAVGAPAGAYSHQPAAPQSSVPQYPAYPQQQPQQPAAPLTGYQPFMQGSQPQQGHMTPQPAPITQGPAQTGVPYDSPPSVPQTSQTPGQPGGVGAPLPGQPQPAPQQFQPEAATGTAQPVPVAQPLHTSTERQQSTLESLARARERSRQAGG